MTGAERVLVTGGGTGIGRGVVEALLAQGARVAVVGRRAEKLAEVQRLAPDRVAALVCDLADPRSREGLVSKAKEALGGLDGFVHSAGVVEHQPLGHVDEASLRAQLEVNLVAPLRLGEEALSELAPGGAMVFVASTLALRPVSTSAVYSASKAGLLSLVTSFAMAGAARGVRANAVVPGVVDTEMVRVARVRPGETLTQDEERARVAEQLEGLRRLHPLGRLGTPGDVAQAVLHLLSAPWTTGASLTVDGGLLSGGGEL